MIAQLKHRHWSVDAIVALLEKHPNGIAEKYAKRLRKEVERSYAKVDGGIASTAPTPWTNSTSAGAATGATTAPRVFPTIRLTQGRLARTINETEQALVASGAPIFNRAGFLVEPVVETMLAADGRKTLIARLRRLDADALLEPIAEAALFQRFDHRRKNWIDADPPLQLARLVLARQRRWTFPHVDGVITAPILRADGSLLNTPGYDPRSELYLESGLQLPPIPEHPTREQAREALGLLHDLFNEFAFRDNTFDRTIALTGLFTAQMRGVLITAPVVLVRADTSGSGKSYLVDVIAMITTGRWCPVITTSKSQEETEKRLGSIILGGSPIVSLDNCTHDLDGELLCQFTERPLVKIRILGRSETPECECRTAVFVTGNNITLKGEMNRRHLVCNLEALVERPELREFKRDALEQAAEHRAEYIAAIFTIIRAYLAAGSPRICGPLGSYAAWSKLVRSPLVWLGEPDPIASMDAARGGRSRPGQYPRVLHRVDRL